MDLLSSIEPVSDEFLDEEQDDSEQYDKVIMIFNMWFITIYTK